jgi:hypothetical protein
MGVGRRNNEEKIKTFAIYFSELFNPNLHEITLQQDNKLHSDAVTATTLDIFTKSFTIKELRTIIKNLNLKKALG